MPDKKPRDYSNADYLRDWAEVMQDQRIPLARKMTRVAINIDILNGAEDAIFSRAMACQTQELQNMWLRILDNYESIKFESVVKEVATQTGADEAQIASKDTRTQEQQQAIIEAYGRRELFRLQKLAASAYLNVVMALDKVDSVFDEPEDASIMNAKNLFVLYYFATCPDTIPSEAGLLSGAEKEALIAQYKRFEAFIVKHFNGAKRASTALYNEWIEALEAFISAENPTNAQEIIEHLSSVCPAKFVIPNNKLANTMTRGVIDIGKITLEESRRGAKKLIETTCILTYEGDNVHLSGRQPFTEYDRNVYNAVSSLYVYGDQSHVVTPAMVYRAMTGLTDSEKPTAGQLAAVTRSLDKMRFIRARIDCTAELQARRITLNSKQINGGEIDTYLLTADAIKVQAGGQTVRAYRIIKTPILYEYAAAVKQVLTLPASVLDVKEISEVTIDGAKKLTIGARLPNTESRILIKGYLIRRIEGMKGKNGLNNPVIALYDYQKDGETRQGLYSIAGKEDPTREEMRRTREDAEKMLAYWAATGYIKSFEAKTERKKITSYIITV